MHFGYDYQREQFVLPVNYAFIRPSSLGNIQSRYKSKISFRFKQIRSYSLVHLHLRELRERNKERNPHKGAKPNCT